MTLTEERAVEIHHHHHPQSPGMKETEEGASHEDKGALKNWNSLSQLKFRNQKSFTESQVRISILGGF